MIPYYYIIINIITLVFWGIDKYKAEQHLWRIPERSLLALVIIGGAFGGLAGMSLFRHKTRKMLFWIMGILFSLIHAIIIFQYLV